MLRLIIPAGIVMILAGCTASSSRQVLDQNQVCTRNFSGRVLAEGTVIGAAGGAAVGAGAGQLAGEKPEIGAAVGAGVGALAGLLYAISVENQNQEAKCQELALDQAIEITQKLNQLEQMMNENLSNYVNVLSEKILLANNRKSSYQASLQQMNSEKDKLVEVQNSITKGILATEQVLGALRAWSVPQSAGSQALTEEVVRLEAQKETLRGHARTLAALGQRL